MHAPRYTHFDPQALLVDLFDNTEIVRTVLGTFENWHSSVQNDLRTAAEAGNTARLSRIAHTLRGTLAQIHAAHAADMATALELRCKAPAQDFLPGPADIEALQRELHAVADEVADYLALP
ncbi:Hpt domain-containing protein [Thauera linaloolentis]|uniref:Hpt domain-containing protein n=1 Tax=Thauera linaloolentis (strain DSM 12138 / JCM 21573 / CCUG 41526 / CIP 105981 / IAM 15112 / NBRC 102519 / 47Lol) TaxID=1123367 RepID=N6XYB1_THAL4|nr:Hpt domain-containing protein [Thauera linaloolentis]ENO86801.1 Hpt domain-containing protein [Thauera linaloolentis 47Lol = DSM 12138]MCM8564827.1 Hpt domain-containing protein [Thauera linaloolentis]